MATIYEALKAAGCELDSHESDLYVKDTPGAVETLRAFYGGHTGPAIPFRSSIDGSAWLEIPFAFDPWWFDAEACARVAAAK